MLLPQPILTQLSGLIRWRAGFSTPHQRSGLLADNRGQLGPGEARGGIWARTSEPGTPPGPATHRVQVLGHTPLPQLLHPLAHVGEAGVVIVGILLGQVVDVAQGAVLRVRRAGKDRGGQSPCKSLTSFGVPLHSIYSNDSQYL